MRKNGIIGHRGAAGLALENSRESIHAALKYPVDALEFDVHRTRDGHLVVLHDGHTGRIAEKKVFIKDKTLTELQALRLKNGQRLLTLSEALYLIGGKKRVVIDIKSVDSAHSLLEILKVHPKVKASFTSLLNNELKKLHEARPDMPICVRDLVNPFRILRTARTLKAKAISLNMRLLNPLTYYVARKRGLEVRIYTVNHLWLARFFRALYPGVVMYTDHPERLSNLAVYDRNP